MKSNNSNFASINDKDIVSILDDLPLWAAPFGQMILDKVNYKSDMKFLDIGSGTGFPLIELSQRLDASEAIGIDPWDAGRERIEFKIKTLKLDNIKILKGYAENIPFKDHYFDLIVSNNGINNVYNLDEALKECQRVLKRKGQFIFTVNLPRTMFEFYKVFKEILRKNELVQLINVVNEHINKKRVPKTVLTLKLKECGFKIINIKEQKFYLKFSNGTSLFNHFFMRLTFIKGWKEIVPIEYHEKIFDQIIYELNLNSKMQGGLKLTVPMICLECTK